MNDLLQQSGSTSAANSYSAYCTGCIGGSSANSSTPFVLPDYDDGQKQGDGYNPPDGSLAEQYDLSRHLDSDRTTCMDGPRETVIKAPAKTPKENTASTTSVSFFDDAPTLSSSRALTAPNAHIPNESPSSNAPVAEKTSETGYITTSQTLSKLENAPSKISHSLDSEHIAYALTANGTNNADTKAVMTRQNQTVEKFQTGPETGFVGKISIVYGGKNDATGDQRGDTDKRETRQNEKFISLNAGAMSVLDESGTSATMTGDAVRMPRMQQISDAIIEQMERMTADSTNSTINLKLDMADGSKLGLRLRWNGNHVKASFDDDSAELRGEIENGWASLALNVGNSGIQLEPPTFSNNTSTGYYA